MAKGQLLLNDVDNVSPSFTMGQKLVLKGCFDIFCVVFILTHPQFDWTWISSPCLIWHSDSSADCSSPSEAESINYPVSSSMDVFLFKYACII